MEAAEKAAEKTRRLATMEEDKQKYHEALGLYNLKVVQVSDDGNCMFRGISYYVYGGIDSHHGYVRQQIVDYMRDNTDEFRE